MKRTAIFTCLVLHVFFIEAVFSQEVLKSVEEDYYDFLSLNGTVERPTLGYRTLSDSKWIFKTDSENFSDGFVFSSDTQMKIHPWKDLNLGTKKTVWKSDEKRSNWFLDGIDRSIKIKVYGPDFFSSVNTASPYGQNDGALWQGKGFNGKFSAGARLELFGLELTLRPEISFSQNLHFDIMPSAYDSEYGYFWGTGSNIGTDLPQRFGERPFFDFSTGDSEIRWTWRTFTVGFGTQSPWLGPAVLNPMLGSNNASPYPKFDVGFRRTGITVPKLNLNLGEIEGRVWVGRLEESDYFDGNLENDKRMVQVLSASYSPSFIPGFTFGINRMFMFYWKPENFAQVLRLFSTKRHNSLATSGNDEDQKISFFADWRFPAIGFEIYGELGRDDFSSDEISNPFHTAIYTAGVKQRIPLHFQKLFTKLPETMNLESSVLFEFNNFEMSQDFQLQWQYMGYYAHGFVGQGYTNKGQSMGAGSGQFGNSQYLSYDVYHGRGKITFMFHRFCPDNNYIYNKAVYEKANGESGATFKDYYGKFETYRSYGLCGTYFLTDSFALDLNLNLVHVHNYRYRSNNTVYNFHGNLTMKYNF